MIARWSREEGGIDERKRRGAGQLVVVFKKPHRLQAHVPTRFYPAVADTLHDTFLLRHLLPREMDRKPRELILWRCLIRGPVIALDGLDRSCNPIGVSHRE